jgi:hypothetical protein
MPEGAVARAASTGIRPWTDADRAARFGDNRGKKVQTARVALSQYVRALTQDGHEIADYMLKIMRGEKVKCGGRWKYPTMRHGMAAADWLANRGFGMPRETIDLTTEDPRAERLTLLSALSAEDRDALRAILQRAVAARETPPIEAEATHAAPEPDAPAS